MDDRERITKDIQTFLMGSPEVAAAIEEYTTSARAPLEQENARLREENERLSQWSEIHDAGVRAPLEQRIAETITDAKKVVASVALERLAWRERLAALTADNERLRAALESPDLLEKLSAAEHARWSGWMRYQEVAAPEKRADWPRKAALDYGDLTNAEQESDRVEARKTLALVRTALAGITDTQATEKEERRG